MIAHQIDQSPLRATLVTSDRTFGAENFSHGTLSLRVLRCSTLVVEGFQSGERAQSPDQNSHDARHEVKAMQAESFANVNAERFDEGPDRL
jgi:hypothetical protein